MTNMIKLPTLNKAGVAAMLALVTASMKVSDPMERREAADAILADPEMCGVADGEVMIDKDARFENAFDVGVALQGMMESLGHLIILNRGINAALHLVYIDQLVGKKARQPRSYILGKDAEGRTRNYRNGLYVFLLVYEQHLKSPGSLPTRLLKNNTPCLMSYTLDNLAQKPGIIASAGIMDFISASMMTEKCKFVRLGKKETGGYVVKPTESLRELSVIVTQTSKNFDTGAMNVMQVVSIMPDSINLGGYKRRAKKTIATRNKLAKSAAAALPRISPA